MKRTNHITAFYLETILLVIVFMGVIIVLTNIFGSSKKISSSAKQLNTAVCLAGNAAEAISASKSAQEAAKLMDADDNVQITDQASASLFRVNYDEHMRPAEDGIYHVDVVWEPEASNTGTLVSGHISVLFGRSEDPVYTLDTAVFIR